MTNCTTSSMNEKTPVTAIGTSNKNRFNLHESVKKHSKFYIFNLYLHICLGFANLKSRITQQLKKTIISISTLS